jgi:hypothetical protein
MGSTRKQWGKSEKNHFFWHAPSSKICVYLPISTKFYIQMPVGTAHLPVVNISERRLDGRSNQGKGGKNDACLHPRSSKIFVHQPISTKFSIWIRVGTVHSKVVKLPKKGVERRSNHPKIRKIDAFWPPGALKFLFINWFRPNFFSGYGLGLPTPG